jgi:transposase
MGSKNFKAQATCAKLLPVVFEEQVLPGSFAHALIYLLDRVELSAFEARYRNEEGGASAYHPRVLLKIVLLAYSRGVVHSRQIEALCRRDVQFMAVSGDTRPQFSTIAGFVSKSSEQIAVLFSEVLLVCSMQGLIGREMFAIDGVKLPSNASKAKSGTRKEMQREAAKMRRAVEKLLAKHQAQDERGDAEPEVRARDLRRIERWEREAQKVSDWLRSHPKDRYGARNRIRKSNRTDNDSAKMATGKGVIQGYTAVAAVDEKHQIIVEAQAHGVGQEQELLGPVVEALAPMRTPDTVLTADSGYHSKENVKRLAAAGIDAVIPDNGYRKRDARYAGQETHRAKPDPLWNKTKQVKKPKLYQPSDFQVAADHSHAICPAGKRLYRNGVRCRIGGYEAMKFTGTKRDCEKCPLRAQCLRHPQRSVVRQVAIFAGKLDPQADAPVEAMKQRVDSDLGKQMITRRFATVEPVFGNIRYNKGLDRFSLRGRQKVDGQWKLYCLVHNIEKLAKAGYGMQSQ